mmetsp:Transcript_56245/g.89127  ORF Transcript_56245/g.89127 Transcript_56245/m.89127 type:complete len:217 (-) Transcript_56245:181-831(-)
MSCFLVEHDFSFCSTKILANIIIRRFVTTRKTQLKKRSCSTRNANTLDWIYKQCRIHTSERRLLSTELGRHDQRCLYSNSTNYCSFFVQVYTLCSSMHDCSCSHKAICLSRSRRLLDATSNEEVHNRNTRRTTKCIADNNVPFDHYEFHLLEACHSLSSASMIPNWSFVAIPMSCSFSYLPSLSIVIYSIYFHERIHLAEYLATLQQVCFDDSQDQ